VIVKLATAFCLLVALPTFLAAQDDPRLDRLDPATRTQVVAVLHAASQRGLPTEPLIDKALEGESRHASGDLIVAAVERLRDGMARVQSILGPGSSASELNAGAHALRAGATEESLRTLRRARPDGDLTTPLGVLDDLVAVGLPPDTATITVAYVVAKGASDIELLELQRNIGNDIRAGYPPVTAAAVRSGLPTAAPPPRAAPAVAVEGAHEP
jgi:hypothetical protein